MESSSPPRDTAGAMSEENVTVVRRMYDAFHRGDAENALDHFAPDVLVDASSVRPDTGVGKGRDHIAAVVSSWMAPWDDWHDEIEEMRDLGDSVLVVSLQRGKGKGSGIEVEARYGLVYGVRGQQITSMRMYGSRAEALEAAGLSE